MDDMNLILDGLHRAINEGTELDDLTAKVIAAQYHNGPHSHAFLSTGAIPSPSDLVWHEMFADMFERQMMGESMKQVANYFGTYLVNAGPRGPVDGWSGLTW